MRDALAMTLVAALAVGSLTTLVAQQPGIHLNPIIAKLAAGRTVYGLINAGDLSMVNARDTARATIVSISAEPG